MYVKKKGLVKKELEFILQVIRCWYVQIILLSSEIFGVVKEIKVDRGRGSIEVEN